MKKLAWMFIVGSLLAASCSKNSGGGTDPVPPPPPPPPPPVVVDSFSKGTAKRYMVDSNATIETVAFFYNLKNMSKTAFAVGQQDAFTHFYKNIGGQSDIKKATGFDPAVLGSDFMFITDISNNGEASNWYFQQETGIINAVKQAYGLGMINIFCWHLREPYEEKVFYASDMTTDRKNKAFKSILPGGENHEWYKRKLDKVASVFSNLKGANGELIPVIFRPFHEFDGNWFWWGANYCTAEEFKTAFRFTVDYLKDVKGVRNVLYSFGPDNSYDTQDKYLSRYPGDKYVDVLGIDNYWDLRNGAGQAGANLANTKMKVVSDLAKSKTKIAAMTETGYQVNASNLPVTGWFSNYLYTALTANNIEVAFVMFWSNSNDGYYVPVAGSSNVNDFIDFTKKPKALLQNKLPKMYTLN
jgi:mannan endo-1,4-beta-mannosidase